MSTMPELPLSFQEYLTRQPETGMGYHLITVTMVDGRIFDAICYNCTYLNLPLAYENINPREIKSVCIKPSLSIQ